MWWTSWTEVVSFVIRLLALSEYRYRFVEELMIQADFAT